MGFLDGLFKIFRKPTPEVEIRLRIKIALRNARVEIGRLNVKAAELTTKYGELREEAKQYLKAGNRGMAEEAARWCCVLKAAIARYEKRAAAAQAMLDRTQAMLGLLDRWRKWDWDTGTPTSTIVLPPEWRPAGIDEIQRFRFHFLLTPWLSCGLT